MRQGITTLISLVARPMEGEAAFKISFLFYWFGAGGYFGILIALTTPPLWVSIIGGVVIGYLVASLISKFSI